MRNSASHSWFPTQAWNPRFLPSTIFPEIVIVILRKAIPLYSQVNPLNTYIWKTILVHIFENESASKQNEYKFERRFKKNKQFSFREAT